MRLGIGLSTHYQVYRHRADGEIVESRQFDNIVLDVGWDEFYRRVRDNLGLRPDYLYLGTGTTEPTPQDTGLESVSGTLPGKATPYSWTEGVGYRDEINHAVCTADLKFIYGQGEAEGVWTELGLSFTSTYSQPYNRSLIRDSGGNPVSLTILSDEFLTVYARLELFMPKDIAVSGTLDYNGATISYTSGLLYDANMASWTANPWSSGMFGKPSLYMKVNGSGTYVDMPITRDPTLAKITTNQITYTPGSSRELVFVNIGGDLWHYRITFSPSIVIPSDHQVTIGQFSMEMTRGTVPV